MSEKPFKHGHDHDEVDPIPGLQLAIRFDRLNGNTADRWLNVLTSEPTPPGSVPGIAFTDTGGAGIKFYAQGSGNDLEAKADGNLLLSGAAGASLASSGGPITIAADGVLGITVGTDTTLTSRGITLTAGATGATSPNGVLGLFAYDNVSLACSVGDTEVAVSNAGSPGDHSFKVTLGGSPATEFFRVDSDGSVHIKTGTAVIADL